MSHTKSLSRRVRGGIKRLLTKISPKLETTINYRYVCGEWLNWRNPQDFNAKINWLKVNTYYNNPLVTMCIDKYKLREYLARKGYSELCPRLYGVYDLAEEIVWDELPQQFVVKCNHACGTNIIVKDKSLLDIALANKKLNSWMKMDYWITGEVQYRFIEKKIIIEEYLGDGTDLRDVKFYCFNGEPKVLYISMYDARYFDYYDMNFVRLPYTLKGHEHYPGELAKPANFDRMIEMARDLSRDFPFVRVDLYDARGTIYLSELTFIPTGGYMKMEPKEVMNEWGDWLLL